MAGLRRHRSSNRRHNRCPPRQHDRFPGAGGRPVPDRVPALRRRSGRNRPARLGLEDSRNAGAPSRSDSTRNRGSEVTDRWKAALAKHFPWNGETGYRAETDEVIMLNRPEDHEAMRLAAREGIAGYADAEDEEMRMRPILEA